MSLAGLVAALGLLVVWLVGYGIARPLRQLVGMLDDIAQGEGDLTRRLSSERADEPGLHRQGLQYLPQTAEHDRPGGAIGAEGQRLSEHTADIAIRTNQGAAGGGDRTGGHRGPRDDRHRPGRGA